MNLGLWGFRCLIPCDPVHGSDEELQATSWEGFLRRWMFLMLLILDLLLKTTFGTEWILKNVRYIQFQALRGS